MTIYAGSSLFFANRTGNHNWLDNRKRPFLSRIDTALDGTKSYNDYFLNDRDIDTTVHKNGKVTLTFSADINKPLFRILTKTETKSQ